MLTHDPDKFWSKVAEGEESEWMRMIFPRRTAEEFESEGEAQARVLSAYFGQLDTVLDYGCGIGRVTRYVANMCEKAIGIDISQRFVERARARNSATNLVFGTVRDYEEKTAVADFIFSLAVLQHNTDANTIKILQHIERLLKPGGTALFNFPNAASSYYVQTGFVRTFLKGDVVRYGELFQSYEIKQGNLVEYKGTTLDENHEYFLKVGKE